MDEEEYISTFFEFRKAFFLAGRGPRRKGTVGTRPYLAKYLGLDGCVEGTEKKLLEAMAYMMYDYVGLVVETAIRARTGGRLVPICGGLWPCVTVVPGWFGFGSVWLGLDWLFVLPGGFVSSARLSFGL